MAPMWQDEEEPQWGVDEPEVAAPAAPADGEKKEAPAEGAEGAPPAEEAPPEDPDAVDPRKYNRHWVRPQFLQYSYLYDYRKNYYDDVIDYLNRRSQGIARELPRPQTWAERVLRTYNQKLGATETAIKTKTDDQLIHSLHHVASIHQHRTRSYYHKVFTIAY